ncbi:hypothetical protein C8F01DRAFT_1145660 [Mycena amicta]|nr:hypothetical protein C8F01DRAFT_1145660 [Mycena amicta]
MSCTTSTARPVLKRSNPSSSSSLRAPLPFVPDMLATIHIPKRIRRFSDFSLHRRRKDSASIIEPEDFESPPVFTIPNYTLTAAQPPTQDVSPLTVPDPAPRRAVSVPSRLDGRAQGKLPEARRSSVDSLASTVVTEASSTLHRRRRSSVTSVQSFSSNEDKVTLKLRLTSLPSTVFGVLMSLASVAATFLVPSLAASAPTQSPHPKTATPRSSSERTVVPVEIPASRAIEVPVVFVGYSAGATARPKGPAPAVCPARKQRHFRLLSKLDSWKNERERKRLYAQGVIRKEW